MSDKPKGASQESESDAGPGDGPEGETVSTDDRHKTEKLTRHDGIDPNEGQE